MAHTNDISSLLVITALPPVLVFLRAWKFQTTGNSYASDSQQ